MLRGLISFVVLLVAISGNALAAFGSWDRPADTLVYYGWMSSFNYPTNAWDNEKVAQDMKRYAIIVLGDGVASTSHGDYANAAWIIARVKVLKPAILIFGYDTTDQDLATFEDKADEWDAIGAHGVFMDEAGYDFGRTRDEFNDRADYAHGLGLLVMANAWYPQHVLGTTDGIGGYYNSTYNPSSDPSSLSSNDYIYLESLAVNTVAYSADSGYEARSQWEDRKVVIETLRASFTISFVGGAVISNTDAKGQRLFEFVYASATMLQLEACGSSDVNYGSGSAIVKFWTRPAYLK